MKNKHLFAKVWILILFTVVNLLASHSLASKCVWYGLCDPSNCVYNGDPISINSTKAVQQLKIHCPTLFVNNSIDEQTKLCCDESAVEFMVESLLLVEQMFGRCPTCLYNFRASVCAIACSPVQSTFINVTSVYDTSDVNDAGIHVAAMSRAAVKAADVYLSPEYMQGVFDSCRDVVSPQTNSYVIETMCVPYSALDCTPSRLYHYLGNNPFSPIKIAYKSVNIDNAFSNFEFSPISCNNSVFVTNLNTTVGACGCTDCIASCSNSAPLLDFNDTNATYYLIFSASMGLFLLIIMCSLFIHVFFFSEPIITSESGYLDHTTEDQSSLPQSASTADLSSHVLENSQKTCCQLVILRWCKFGERISSVVRECCYIWTLFCLGNKKCIFIVLFIFCSLFCGMIYSLKITTDPVKLWSSSSSRVRLEKDYFDSNFGPFYRTQMLIIRPALNKSPFNYSNTSSITFGPVFRYDFLSAVLNLQNDITYNISGAYNNRSVHLADICVRPLFPSNKNCLIQSLLEYFQNKLSNMNLTQYEVNTTHHYANLSSSSASNFNSSIRDSHLNYLDHIKTCTNNPLSVGDSNYADLPCISSWGGPSLPNTILGGFSDREYLMANVLVITWLVENKASYSTNNMENSPNGLALAWEKAFLTFLSNYNNSQLDISYYSERSVQDELARESHSDLFTVLLAYTLMFIYIALSLGTFNACSVRILIGSRFMLGFAGVLFVLVSVVVSLSFYACIDFEATPIVLEVVPFLVLAVGVDNIFLIVERLHHDLLQRDSDETLRKYTARIMVVVGPSLFLSTSVEVVCFFIGSLIPIPVVRSFALFAGLALLINYILQMTVFLILTYCDLIRQQEDCFDICCCLKYSQQNHCQCCFSGDNSDSSDISDNSQLVQRDTQYFSPGFIHCLFQDYISKFLFYKFTRLLVMVVFVLSLMLSFYASSFITIGLDQELAMPSDSYVLKYFKYQKDYMRVGPPVYFVVRDGLNMSSNAIQNRFCSTFACDEDSLANQIASASLFANRSYIASKPNNWLDDYFDWCSAPSDTMKCCSVYISNHSFCPTFDKKLCVPCNISMDKSGYRPDTLSFTKYLPYFLQSMPSVDCPKGGHGAYNKLLNLNVSAFRDNYTRTAASAFMTYHTELKSSTDFYSALEEARLIADNFSLLLHNHSTHVEGSTHSSLVFPYSVFYVFYEQYLTIWRDTYISLSICLLAVFIVSFLISGLSFLFSAVLLLVVCMILVHMFAWMVLCNISLNVVSLVNLMMAIGISVEFASHIIFEFFSKNTDVSIESHAINSFVKVGPSVFKGITLTKFIGISVLAFSRSQIFSIYYFRMYVGMIFISALHALVFLPVLLSFIESRCYRQIQNIIT